MAAEPVVRTLKAAWQCLEPFSLPMALMGGLSVSIWKHSRATRDVDILIDLQGSSPSALIDSLAQCGFRLVRTPPILTIGDTRILQVLYEPRGSYLDIRTDLLFADTEYPRTALSRRSPAQLPNLDIVIQVLSCEDIIIHKLLAGRFLDKADSAALLRANRADLDVAYLAVWLQRLNLMAEWRESWEEAFPGESPPSA